MNTGTTDWSKRFPRLFQDSYVDYPAARIMYVEGAAPEDLVSGLHIVAVTDHAEVVVCRNARGGRCSDEAMFALVAVSWACTHRSFTR